VLTGKWKRCGGCRSEYFCSREHFEAAWPIHSAACLVVQEREEAARRAGGLTLTAEADRVLRAARGGGHAVMEGPDDPRPAAVRDAEAALAVDLCRYPPQGHRSMAALGPTSGYQRLPAKESLVQRNASVMVVAMIETQSGLDHAQAIAAVPGVDALMMGPMDLSLELGIPGELRHPRILAAYDTSVKAAVAAGKHFVCGDAGGPPVAQLVAQGARILLGSNDANYLLQALSQAAQTLDREAQINPA
jgi:hypothetical protein